jgi:hypothetical protein
MHEACTTLPACMQEANNFTPDPADGVTRVLQWRRVCLFAFFGARRRGRFLSRAFPWFLRLRVSFASLSFSLSSIEIESEGFVCFPFLFFELEGSREYPNVDAFLFSE